MAESMEGDEGENVSDADLIHPSHHPEQSQNKRSSRDHTLCRTDTGNTEIVALQQIMSVENRIESVESDPTRVIKKRKKKKKKTQNITDAETNTTSHMEMEERRIIPPARLSPLISRNNMATPPLRSKVSHEYSHTDILPPSGNKSEHKKKKRRSAGEYWLLSLFATAVAK